MTNTATRTTLLALPAVAIAAIAFSFLLWANEGRPGPNPKHEGTFTMEKSDAEWREELTDEEYRILRKAGTERAFSGKYWDYKKPGTYVCAGCGQPLFSSETKFRSGTGWPSFWKPVAGESVIEEKDRSFGMTRTEVLCSRCGGHLGHVFPDGPKPTGQRYCINSAALEHVPEGEETESGTTAKDEAPADK